jgi:hypothetical protein
MHAPVVELPAVTFRDVIAMDPLRKIHCRREAHRFERYVNRNRGGEKTRRSRLLARAPLRSAHQRHDHGDELHVERRQHGAKYEAMMKNLPEGHSPSEAVFFCRSQITDWRISYIPTEAISSCRSGNNTKKSGVANPI